MKEIWKSVIGYDGLYEISMEGRVWSLSRRRDIRQFKNWKGYWMVALCKDSKSKHRPLHRLIAEAFIPNPENKSQVNHKDGNKDNNKIENLEWVTGSENILHACHVLGTNKTFFKPGRKPFIRKLKEDDVIYIKKELSKSTPRRYLADKFNVHIDYIGQIDRGQRWQCLNQTDKGN